VTMMRRSQPDQVTMARDAVSNCARRSFPQWISRSETARGLSVRSKATSSVECVGRRPHAKLTIDRIARSTCN
jgi:hypothetical protein